MTYRFQFRRYRLPFRHAVRTAHGGWSEREGVIVRIRTAEDGAPSAADNGRRTLDGFGEAAPVPGFRMESVDEIAAACAEMGEFVDEARLRSVPENLPTLRNAIGSALDSAAVPAVSAASRAVKALGVAALLPAGRAALEQIPVRAEAGFRIFKWKVGVGDVADELALLDDVCAALPAGAKLRLDANGAWDRRKAERWLERCADRPVEFVEQPTPAGNGGRETDLLLGLAGDFPTKLALDESLVGDGDAERWIGAGWPGVFVVKPALFGDLAGALERFERAQADVVFSSALETTVGARAALRAAFAWNERRAAKQASVGELETGAGAASARNSSAATPAPRALGFGVWPLFADARCDGPAAAPFIRWEDVERLDAARVWAALFSEDGERQRAEGGR